MNLPGGCEGKKKGKAYIVIKNVPWNVTKKSKKTVL